MNDLTNDEMNNTQGSENIDEESLVLYFYKELSKSETERISAKLAESSELSARYHELLAILEEKLEPEIPQPSSTFEQNIMAAVIRESETAKDDLLIEREPTKGKAENSASLSIIDWLKGIGRFGFLSGGAIAFALLAGVFFIGRWSAVEMPLNQVADSQSQNQSNPSMVQNVSELSFTKVSSARLLNRKVAEHLDAGSRILTMVSNGNGDLARQIKDRRLMIEELVVFNRIYRRLAQSNGDKQLVALLSQLELMLVELENNAMESDSNSQLETFNQVKQRVENSDLIYRLKVTNKKHQKNFI